MAKSMKTEEKIFRSAIAIFVKYGKHGAKMQAIADEAKINKAMLFYYFINKEQLYTHVVETVFIKMFGSLHTIFEENKPFSISLRLFIDRYIDMLNSNPQISLFILRELGSGDDAALGVINKLNNDGRFTLPQIFVDSARKAIQKGEIKAINTLQLMFSVFGVANYFFLSEPMMRPFLDKQTGYERQEFLQQLKHDIFDLVYNGIKFK